ncbi:MAG: 4Fe-4S dicluster domain-containing protein [bacterium]|nr:4Fe-4S dicluster domain-containing protein [bacterium]
MTEAHEPLTPFSLADLLARISHEWESRHRIFDLPTARFFNVSKGPDISMDFLGRPAATPVGPAAGPHSQMAQNIVLSWLAGSRLIELKTVQIMDELEIGRPCIDMETIGYNIEWSQELKIPQSLEEYVKAWMIIEMMRRWDEVTPLIGTDTGPLVFDLSVGYDLAGISTDQVAWFIDSMMDAREEIERLRPQIGGEFARFRDMDFPARIADTVTLSTFHGCPPDEIESITKHLITRHGLDVIVKLNPTLLGFERVKEIVIETLGYETTVLRKEDFDNDLQFPRGLELIGELSSFASEHGRRFGIKLTNTLVVENTKGFMPDDTMYLSGPPLHVVSTTLLGELHRALPGMLRVDGQDGPVQVSFSAGITKENLPAAAGLGLAPMTVCSDLLKPGGYGRLAPMLKNLWKAMEGVGAGSLREWQAHRAEQSGEQGPVAAYIATLHNPATNRRYTLAGNSKLPRSVDNELQMWGCVACNFCVTVCPNDAFFRIPTPDELDATGLQQYLVLTELCNDCGNCMVFCPEIGDPAVVKPRLFIDPDRFEAETDQAFLIHQDPDGYWVQPNAAAADHTGDLLLLLNAEEGFVLPPSSKPWTEDPDRADLYQTEQPA